MAKKVRDHSYYLPRLEKEAPAVFADFKAGHFKSLTEALEIAGIKKAPGPLSVLKREWRKASPQEQADFSAWAGIVVPSSTASAGVVSVSPSSGPNFAGRRCTDLGSERIRTIKSKRGLRLGQVMSEIGFNPLNTSLANALGGTSPISTDMITALEVWIEKNKAHWAS